MNILELYNEEIKRTSGNVIAVILVGSYVEEQDSAGNDVDLFVILEDGLIQTRTIKTINGVELDINYFPLELAVKLIDEGEYFFIYELSERARVLLDTEGACDSLIQKAKERYLKGPNPATYEEICLIRHEADSLIKRIKTETDMVQRNINGMSCLVKLLKAYFKTRGIWCPKEKNIAAAIKGHDEAIYFLAKEFMERMNIENLDKISEKVFRNIEVPKELNIEY